MRSAHTETGEHTTMQYHELRCDTCDRIIGQLLIEDQSYTDDELLPIINKIFELHMLNYKMEEHNGRSQT